MYTAVHPDDPLDPALLRNEWEGWEAERIVERYVALREARPAGVVAQSHADWQRVPERFTRVSAELMPALRAPWRLEALYAFAEDRARADGARTLIAWSWEHDALLVPLLQERGYREERRERFWELDLVAERARLEAMAMASRARMREQGIEVTTLDRVADPEKGLQLWRMSNEASEDTPRSTPFVPMTLPQFTGWMRSPGLREDRIWVARESGEIVGVSMLSYPPTRGVVSTDWTGTARRVRGRGVARALKCETLLQAIALGVPRVRTDNDSRNAPILHLNESMGYRRRPEMIQFHKPA